MRVLSQTVTRRAADRKHRQDVELASTALQADRNNWADALVLLIGDDVTETFARRAGPVTSTHPFSHIGHSYQSRHAPPSTALRAAMVRPGGMDDATLRLFAGWHNVTIEPAAGVRYPCPLGRSHPRTPAQRLLDGATPEQAAEVVSLAERVLERAHLPIGATLRVWPENHIEVSLETILGRLNEYPGLGWSLVAAGLEHAVVRIRRVALRALRTWSPSHWPTEARAVLERLRWVEPDPALRALFVEVSAVGDGDGDALSMKTSEPRRTR
jgi:hypothetical protein